MPEERVQVTITATAEQLRSVFGQAGREVENFASKARETGRGLGTAFEPLRHHIGELHENFKKFGESVNQMADRIAPHFKEIFALSLAGAAAEMKHLADSSADEIKHLVNFSAQLGISTGDLEAFHLVGAEAGVSADKMDRALFLMSRRMGQMREEMVNTVEKFHDFNSGVSTMRGSMHDAADDAKRLAGGVHNVGQEFAAGITVIRGKADELAKFDWKEIFSGIIADTTTTQMQKYVAMADQLTKVKDPLIQNALAMQFMGRSAKEAIAAFKDAGPAVEEASKKIEHSGLALTKYDEMAADFAKKTRAQFDTWYDRIEKIFGIEFGRPLMLARQFLINWANENGETIRKFAHDIGDLMEGAVQGIINAITEVQKGAKIEGTPEWARTLVNFFRNLPGYITDTIEAIKGFAKALDPVATALSKVIGHDIGGWGILAGAAFLKLSGGLSVITTGLTTIIGLMTTIALLVSGPAGWTVLLIAGLAAAGVAIYTFRDQIAEVWRDNAPQWLQGLVSAIYELNKVVLGALWETIKYAFEGWKTLILGVNTVLDALYSRIPDVSKAVQSLWEYIKGALSSLGSLISGAASASAASSAPSGAQTGGHVRGPGGIDRVPIMATAGEFMMRTAAVDKYGLGFMHAVNAGRFAMGGLIDGFRSILPERLHLAEGGAVPALASGPLVPIHLHLGGQVFATHADSDVANRLARYSSGRQISSNGAKPSWFG